MKLDPSKPKSKWVKSDWFLNPRYRWYYRDPPEHIEKLLGNRAAPLEEL